MNRLSLKDLKRLSKHPSPKSPILRVALIGDTATQFLATAIRGLGVAKGYNIDLFEAEYNQLYQQFMDPGIELYKHDAEFIVLFQSTHKLCEKHSLLSTQEQTTVADERLHFVESVAAMDSAYSPMERLKLHSCLYRNNRVYNEVLQLCLSKQCPEQCGFQPLDGEYQTPYVISTKPFTADAIRLSKLDDIVSLCRSHKVRLVITYAPTLRLTTRNGVSQWVDHYCKTKHIPFYDYSWEKKYFCTQNCSKTRCISTAMVQKFSHMNSSQSSMLI